MKNKNILLLLENHVDKIILAVSILASLVLLWVFVIGSPYKEKVKVGGWERKLGPSEIDRSIKDAAEAAASELDKPAPPPPVRNSNYLAEYNQRLQSSISDISSAVTIPVPGVSDEVVPEDRTYTLPEIPSLAEVAIGYLRGAAEVPIDQVGSDETYASSSAFGGNEIEDIDLVTVSARFDTQSLYKNFEQSFMGPRLKTFEQDARLAKPVFAKLELQRRAKTKRGDWGNWVEVPRTSIDSNRKLLEGLPLVLDESSFGVDLWISQYDSQDVQYDILQPQSYEFRISPVEWMAPEYQKEALDIMKKEEQQARREKLEEIRERRTDRPTDTRRRITPRNRTSNRNMPPGMTPRDSTLTRPQTRVAQKERTVEDVQKDFDQELLDEKSNLRSLQDPLLVWAHDDTVEPGMTYQYRIRIGVFNPISGKDWFRDNQADYKNQLVLWSQYSQPTEEVFIPKRIYVFPMEVIANKDTPNDTKGVQVEIAKYYRGRWRNFDFDAYSGEIMGYEVEDVEEEDASSTPDTYQSVQKPESVDFTSDMTLVDVDSEIFWGSRFRRSVLYNMIYCDANGNIQQSAVGKGNWKPDMRKMYNEIQESIERATGQGNFEGMDQSLPPDMMPPGMLPPGMMPPGM